MLKKLPPEQDEIEFSIFGPGYGESIAIHLGNSQWILIDSCHYKDTYLPSAFVYLDTLNIDLEQAVKMIIATHWHDDHIGALGNLLELCKGAEFVLSDALNEKEFATLVSSYGISISMNKSGVDEFNKIFATLKKRKQIAKCAVQDRLLFRGKPLRKGWHRIYPKVYSLSPSDSIKLLSSLHIATLLPMAKSRKNRVPDISPNDSSVVLLVEIGDMSILLGGDLPKSSNPDKGWSCIINNCKVISKKADLFKLPHHGGQSAHDDCVWSNLLTKNPYATLTPFYCAGTLLPSESDINRITKLTDKAYITSIPERRRYRFSERLVREMIEQTTKEMYCINPKWGHIRLRRKIDASDWSVELSDSAQPLRAS